MYVCGPPLQCCAGEEEKQKLLEALTVDDKIKTLESIINFYLHEVNFNNQTIQ